MQNFERQRWSDLSGEEGHWIQAEGGIEDGWKRRVDAEPLPLRRHHTVGGKWEDIEDPQTRVPRGGRWYGSVITLRDHLSTTHGTDRGENRINEEINLKICLIGYMRVSRIKFFLYYWGLVLTVWNRKPARERLTQNMRSFLSYVKAQSGNPGLVWLLCKILKTPSRFGSPLCPPSEWPASSRPRTGPRSKIGGRVKEKRGQTADTWCLLRKIPRSFHMILLPPSH